MELLIKWVTLTYLFNLSELIHLEQHHSYSNLDTSEAAIINQQSSTQVSSTWDFWPLREGASDTQQELQAATELWTECDAFVPWLRSCSHLCRGHQEQTLSQLSKGSKAAVFLQKGLSSSIFKLAAWFYWQLLPGQLSFSRLAWTSHISIPMVVVSTTETWAVLQPIELVCFHSNIILNNNISSFQAAWYLLGKTHLSYSDMNVIYTHVQVDVTEVCLRQPASRVETLLSWDIICPSHTKKGICKRVWPKAKLMPPERISPIIRPAEQTSQAFVVLITENNPQTLQ